MRYLALGDSISIDDYTGIQDGGAASQFAALLNATEFQNLAYDGCTTEGILGILDHVEIEPDVITLTVGGNDFLQAAYKMAGSNHESHFDRWTEIVQLPLSKLQMISARLANAYKCVIINTIYDPTDADDSLAEDLGVPFKFRTGYSAINNGIRAMAKQYGFILADLEKLFAGHGLQSENCWFTGGIEPNHAGATAIAHHWIELYSQYLESNSHG